MFFYFFFDSRNLNDNELVRDAFEEVFFRKLRMEGYCDLNPVLGRPRIAKMQIADKLNASNSPLERLFRLSYPHDEISLEKILTPVLQEIVAKNTDYSYTMDGYAKFALVYYILQVYKSRERKHEKIRELYKNWSAEEDKQSRIEISPDDIAYDASIVDLITISSVNEYTEFLRGIQGGSKRRFYRGHSDISYSLLPSLFREIKWLNNEKQMYLELITKCPHDFENLPTHLEKLAEMQHYGLPTRLLDITQNPLVALFFACESNFDYCGEVVVFEESQDRIKYSSSDKVAILTSLPLFTIDEQLDFYKEIQKGHSLSSKVDSLTHEVRMERPGFASAIKPEDVSDVTVCIPPRKNRRIENQEGAFIVCGLIDNIYGSSTENKVSSLRLMAGKRRIICVIKSDKKKELLRDLDNLGINKAKIYPEIDDVADYIKNHV